MDKKILIITYEMVPYASSWGGCQRIFFLAEQLSAEGIKVVLICRKSQLYGFYGMRPNFIIKALDMNGELYSVDFDYEQKSTNIPISNKLFNKIIHKLKKNRVLRYAVFKYLKYSFNNPSPVDGYISWKWSRKATREIKTILEQEKISKVLISGPPFGIFRIITILREFDSSLQIYMDYRDPWNLWSRGGRASIKKEKQALLNSTIVTVTTDEMKKDLASTYRINTGKIFVIANGFNNELWQHVENISIGEDVQEITTFSFVGSITVGSPHSFRDPSVLISAFQKVLIRNPDIYLKFYGVVDADCDNVKRIVKETGNHIIFYPNISQLEALRMMRQSDVLVQIHTASDNSGNYLVSGKVYDYIRARKPILSIGKPLEVTQQIVDSLNLGLTVENSEDEIVEALFIMSNKKYLDNYKKNFNLNILEFSRQAQNKKWKDLIFTTC